MVTVCTAIVNMMACFKCGQAGHVTANCPQLGGPPTGLPPCQNRPRGLCWVCGKKGHFYYKKCLSSCPLLSQPVGV
uniref:CCHC-type domain-containing protein n=1 Tax=Anas zonorhyncha TaxID=75864 RepID=A0A8B9VV79_9AVES